MATVTFLAYVKPRNTFAISEARTAGFTAYVPIRSVSGLYSTGIQQGNTKDKKRWRPSALHPIGTTSDGKSVLIDAAWMQHFSYLGQKKLGGADFATLPDVAGYVTTTQFNSAIAAQQSAIAALQMQLANAQVLKTLVEVVQATGAAGSTQIPAVALAPAETTPPPTQEPPGGGGGGD